MGLEQKAGETRENGCDLQDMARPRPPGICFEKIFGTREDVSRPGEAVAAK
jgi:hypothetical protein